MTTTIYHNPRCSKSRQTLELLKERGETPEIIEYLKTPLSEQNLTEILKKLQKPAHEIVRQKEPEYKEAKLDQNSSEQEITQAIATYPKLLERPIVIKGNKAAIGRPPEQVLEIL